MARDSKRVKFYGNEGVALTDFEDVQKAMTQRAWEWPDYTNVVAAGWPKATSYPVAIMNPEDAYAHRMVFTKGGGLAVQASSTVYTILEGFLGMYTDDAPPEELDLTSPSPKMRWVFVETGDHLAVDLSLHLPTAGNKRYVLLQAEITEVDTDQTTRHFKDAVTGAVTSTPNTEKRTAYQLAVTVKQGTEAASNPTIPTADAGKGVIATIHLDENGVAADGFMDGVIDNTFPFGPMHIQSMPAPLGSLYNPANWTVNWTTTMDLTSAVSGSFAVTFPFPFAGNPHARLVRMELEHSLSSGASVNFGRYAWGTGLAESQLTVVGGTDFTADGTKRTLSMDFLGAAILGSGYEPLWGHGEFNKGVSIGDGTNGLAMRVTPTVGDAIHGVRWYALKA